MSGQTLDTAGTGVIYPRQFQEIIAGLGLDLGYRDVQMVLDECGDDRGRMSVQGVYRFAGLSFQSEAEGEKAEGEGNASTRDPEKVLPLAGLEVWRMLEISCYSLDCTFRTVSGRMMENLEHDPVEVCQGLELPDAMYKRVSWDQACEKLVQMDQNLVPHDRLQCIVDAVDIIVRTYANPDLSNEGLFSSMPADSAKEKEKEKAPEVLVAQELQPAFIFLALKAGAEPYNWLAPHASLTFVKTLSSPDMLSPGETAYCLTMMEAALEHITNTLGKECGGLEESSKQRSFYFPTISTTKISK